MTVTEPIHPQQKPEENKLRMSERVMKALRKQTPTEVAAEVVGEIFHTDKADEVIFNQLCAEFMLNKSIHDKWKDAVERSRTQLQSFVDRSGFVPTNADKTMRYATEQYQVDVTRAVATEINDDRVEEFQTVCRRGRIASLFPQVFTRHVSYSLAPGADKVIKAAMPTKKFKEAFFAVYALCFTPKPKSPSLTVVDLVAAKAKREQADAAKAAKKRGGKAAA